MNKFFATNRVRNMPVHTNIFIRLYRGEYSLPITFWIFSVLGVPIFACILLNIFRIITELLPYQYSIKLSISVLAITICASFLLICVYCYIIIVGQWRAAHKYTGKRYFAIAVRVMVVFQVLFFLMCFNLILSV